MESKLTAVESVPVAVSGFALFPQEAKATIAKIDKIPYTFFMFLFINLVIIYLYRGLFHRQSSLAILIAIRVWGFIA